MPNEFPLDDATLIMLAASCEMNDDSGRTHLQDFLHMGSRVKSTVDISDEVEGEGAPVYFVEHEEGFEPFSEHQAIRALVAEVLRLRGERDGLQAVLRPFAALDPNEFYVGYLEIRDAVLTAREALEEESPRG